MRTRICLLVLLGFTAELQASDWPCFQGPGRDGTSDETGLMHSFPESGPETLWTVKVEPGFGGAAVRDGEVYILDRVLGDRDILRVFDLETGAERWRFEHEVPGRLMYPGSRSVPTVAEDFVYAAGGFGHLYCIDRKTHEAEWILDVQAEFEGEQPMFGYAVSPLLIEDLVVIAPMGPSAGLVALDRYTAEEVWRIDGVGSSHSTPTVLNLMGRPQILFVSSKIDASVFEGMDAGPPEGAPLPGLDEPRESEVPEGMADFKIPGEGLLTAVSPQGEVLWQSGAYYCSTPIPTPIRIGDDRVLVTGGYDAGSVLLRLGANEKGYVVEEVFRSARGGQIHLPILVKDHIYLIVNENSNDPRPRHKNGGLMCVDLEGNEKWRTGDDPFLGRGSMILADGILIIQDGRSGYLRLVEPSPEGYKQLAEANIFGKDQRRDHRIWAPMALSNGHLLMRSQDELKCLRLTASAD